MLVASRAIVASLVEAAVEDRPLLLWRNLVTFNTISATSELAGYPASNLANPSTQPLQGWRSNSTGVQYLTVSPIASDRPISAIGIAAHNLGSTGTTISVERLAPDDGADWVEVLEPFTPGSDTPLLLWFEDGFAAGVRVKLVSDPVTPVAPEAAVLYAGHATVMEKGVQAGHVPLPYGRSRSIVTGLNTKGAFLGRIIVGGTLRSEATMINLTPAWYRSELDAFAEASAETPFFWAWRPTQYPDEVGYAWLTSELVPNPAQKNGRINVTFQMEGIA